MIPHQHNHETHRGVQLDTAVQDKRFDKQTRQHHITETFPFFDTAAGVMDTNRPLFTFDTWSSLLGYFPPRIRGTGFLTFHELPDLHDTNLS